MNLSTSKIGLLAMLLTWTTGPADDDSGPIYLSSSQLVGEPIKSCGDQTFVPRKFLNSNTHKIHEYDAKYPSEEIALDTWNLTSIDSVKIDYNLELITASFYFSELTKHPGIVVLHSGIVITFDVCKQAVISISETKY